MIPHTTPEDTANKKTHTNCLTGIRQKYHVKFRQRTLQCTSAQEKDNKQNCYPTLIHEIEELVK